jgi:cohesin loading factor subunit SCC2
MRLFETSLVTVPADASARTMAFYVEKSMKTNKESKMAVKKKVKIEKNQDTEKVETKEAVERDAKAIDLMVASVEDALRSEEKEVQVNTLRSVLDFLKAEQATDGSDAVAKTLSLDDIVKAVDGVFESRFNDIKETVVALASTAKETVEKSAEKTDEKTDEKTIEKGKEEDKEVDIEKSAEKVEKKEVEAPAEDSRVEKLERSIEALTETIKTNMPIRKGLGAESHKEDIRGEKEEDGDITKSAGYAKLSPLDKLKALHEQAEKVANAE